VKPNLLDDESTGYIAVAASRPQGPSAASNMMCPLLGSLDPFLPDVDNRARSQCGLQPQRQSARDATAVRQRNALKSFDRGMPPGPTMRRFGLFDLKHLAPKLSNRVSRLDKKSNRSVHHPPSTSFAIASRAMRLRSAALV
jgi:hypothetical protein